MLDICTKEEPAPLNGWILILVFFSDWVDIRERYIGESKEKETLIYSSDQLYPRRRKRLLVICLTLLVKIYNYLHTNIAAVSIQLMPWPSNCFHFSVVLSKTSNTPIPIKRQHSPGVAVVSGKPVGFLVLRKKIAGYLNR